MHVVCPRCAKGFPVGPTMTGQLVPCPSCKQQVRILPPPPPPTGGCKLDAPWQESLPVIKPIPPPVPRPLCRIPRWAWFAVVAGCLVAWFFTRGYQAAGLTWINYSLLLGACCALIVAAQTRWLPWWFFFAAAPALSVVAIGIHAWTDTYVVAWTKAKGPEAPEWIGVSESLYQDNRGPEGWALVRFRDTHKRWGSAIHPVYRHAEYFPDADNPEVSSFAMSGPMSPSGKLHGQWAVTTWEPYEEFPMWFWYGTTITEGEWRLRTR